MIEATVNSATAKMVLDSVSNEGIRLPTIQLRYPRMVHGEFLTHRVFTRNGRSSRAVPVKRLVTEAPYVPHFMKNKPGMSASEEFDPATLKQLQDRWEEHARATQDFVAWLDSMGVHKQWANRPLEWFGYIDVLLSSTDIANFMALRDEGGAQPEIQDIAKAIQEVMEGSVPKLLKPGEWHMPYITHDDYNLVHTHLLNLLGEHPEEESIIDHLRMVSVARCARLSIAPFDGDGSIEKELSRYEKLMVSRPVHASPAEHIATPDTLAEPLEAKDGTKLFPQLWNHEPQHGNYYGWRQFRHMIKDNTVYDR